MLSINYLNNLSKYNNPAFKNMAISFGKGIAGFYKDGNYIDFRDVVQKYPSMGQAYIGYWKDNTLELPPLYSHHNLDQNIPVIVDSIKTMYLQTYHATQDTHYRFSNNATGISIEAELAKFPKSKNYKNLLDSFPLLENNILTFSNNKKKYYSIRNINLTEKYNILSLDKMEEKNIFEIEFDITLPENLVSPKALLMSFSFNKEIHNINGLTLSNNNKIGWYKYLSSINGTSSGTFSFSTDTNIKINEVNLVIWDDRFKSININSLDIL